MSIKGYWQRVKVLLKQKKITHEDAAKECSINYNTWRGWITKNLIPGLRDSVKIAEFLDISLDYLATGKERYSKARIVEIQMILEKANDKLLSLK